jgi:hypothetical protein
MRKRDLHAFKLYVEQGRLLSPPPPRPLPPTRDKRLAGSVCPAPPPSPTHPLWLKYVIFRVFGQKRGLPLFRGSEVLQLNSDSFCDYVRIWTEVIGHLWAELGLWFFPEKRWKYSRPRTLRGREYFGRSCRYNRPVQYGRDAAHISWAVWEQIPLEDCMEERQHHLRESSSAGLRRSQKLEILPSPNSKSLDAYICGREHLL